MSGLTLTTVIESNSGEGATCGVGVGFWACCECAAIRIKIAPQNIRSSVIGVMCVMKVSFFLGKKGLGVCDITLKAVNGVAVEFEM